MPVGMTVEIPGMTAENYQQVMSNMNWSDDDLPEGFLSHHACEKPDGLFVFDVWESAEDWQRFAESRLGPAIAAATGGEGPGPETALLPAHPRGAPLDRVSAAHGGGISRSSGSGSAVSTSRCGGVTRSRSRSRSTATRSRAASRPTTT